MAITIDQKHTKEIIALNDFEAVRLRPDRHIGQTSLLEERLPIIENNKLINIEKRWSPGFHHLFVEILENAIDEAKRCTGRKMKNINVVINLDTNGITITDEGNGFYKGHQKHSRTHKNVVQTAFEELNAGSNFKDTDLTVLGTHGVGAAICNILSCVFEVDTVNSSHKIKYRWEDYILIDEEKRTKTKGDKKGTRVHFIPSKDVFGNMPWDLEIIKTYLSYKKFLIKFDKNIKDLNINVDVINDDGESAELELSDNFIPEGAEYIKTEMGQVYIWKAYEDSCSLSFINGSRCTGIHQKIINDWVNDYFKYNLAHHFYETLIILDLPSKLMRFGDQNKTKYSIPRIDIEEKLQESFKNKLLKKLKGSQLSNEIEDAIEDKMYNENIKKIKRAGKNSKRKISDKYSPASRRKTNIFIAEGLSAAGSIKQSRKSEYEGVYAIKGKIKNTRKLSDLTNNKEILDIINILGIDPSKETPPSYEKIIIAADQDSDGHHITALLINFFHKWFPHLLEQGYIYKLATPLVACKYKGKKKYFYSMEEFNKYKREKIITDVNYLKGLGSLSIEDWENVMKDRKILQLVNDKHSNKYLDIAFGDSSKKRRSWLEGKV